MQQCAERTQEPLFTDDVVLGKYSFQKSPRHGSPMRWFRGRTPGPLESGALGLLAGATGVGLLPILPPSTWAAVLFVVGTFLVIVRGSYWLGCVLAGAGLAALTGALSLGERLETSLAGRDLVIEGLIAGIPDAGPHRVRFLFEPDRSRSPAGVPARVLLSWYEAPVVPEAGHRWRLTVRLRPPRGSANPGVFDYERWLLVQGVGATGYVRRSSANLSLSSSADGSRLLAFRHETAVAVRRALGNHGHADVITALTLGIRSGVDEATREVLRASGTAHLLAISGLHVGMVAGLGALLGRLAWMLLWRVLRVPPGGPGRRACAAAAGWLLAAGYTALAGAGLPTRRALLMLTVLLLMLLARRRFGTWAPLSVAVIVLLVCEPLAVLSPGFWLSVTAVAGLTAAAAGYAARPGAARGMMAAQWAVSLALLLPGVLLLGGFPTYGPAANLIAIPLFTLFVVPFSLAGLACLFVSVSFATAVWTPVVWFLDLLLPALSVVASLPGAWLAPPRPSFWALVGAALAVVVQFAPVTGVTRAAAILLAVPALLWRPAALPEAAFRLSVLDVGQGLSAVIQTRDRVLVFDAGPAWRSGRDAGSAIVAPFLEASGIGRIDALVLSHGDGDHRGGVDGLLGRVPVDRVWAGPHVQPMPAGTTPCRAGESWRWNGVSFRFLHPPRSGRWTGNDSSCVLAVAGPGGRVLLTGDIELRAESALIRSGARLGADLVVAPHHGSRTSSTPAFVAATAPRWVVFAAAYGNRWGFPAPDVTARWRDAGARVWSTGEAGAVQLTVGPSGPDAPPEGWRCRERRFWRPARCRDVGDETGAAPAE